MKYFYALTFFIFSLPLFSSAQSNYKPGYIVNLKGDTLKGYIDFREWDKNPVEFYFKSNINSNERTLYSKSNTAFVAVNGLAYFKKAYLQVSQDKTDVTNLPIRLDTSKIADTVFLRVISTGKNVSLYAYKDWIKKRFFFNAGDAPITELVYHKYLDSAQNGNQHIIDSYKRQLSALAVHYQPQNQGLLVKISNSDYSETSLSGIVYQINGATSSQNISAQTAGSRFFAGIGANSSSVTYAGDGVPAGVKASSIFPEVNLGNDWYFNKNVGDILFRLELSLSGSNIHMSYTGEQGVATIVQTIKYNQYAAALSPQFLYNFYNTDKAKIFVSVGFNFNFYQYANNQNQIVYVTYGVAGPSTPTDVPDQKVFVIGTTVKAGFVINKRVEVYVGYNPQSGLNDNAGYNLKMVSYHGGLNFFFGR